MSRGFPACAVAIGRWRSGLAAPAIAAPLIAASVLAPSGVTAGIQADPVCLPVTTQAGHSYPLTVYVSGGSLTLTVTTAHGSLERTLHQVPSSWVSFAANPAGPGQVALTLAIPDGAALGAYWSDIEAATQGQAQPGAGAQAALGAAATTALVLTVGPSATPPPPCDALDLAQSTGKFPAWPTEAFRTNSRQQVFAREKRDEPTPNLSPTAIPTAGTGPSAAPDVPAAAYSPAAATSKGSSGLPADWPGWLVIIGLILVGLAALRKRFRS